MPVTGISPLDGYYRAQGQAVAPYFSKWALLRYRLQLDLAWLLLRSERPACPQVHPLSAVEKQPG